MEPQIVDLRIFVPKDDQGSIIGPNGSKINKITTGTKTKIQFLKPTNIVSIKGSLKDVENARILIRLTSSISVKIPIIIREYDRFDSAYMDMVAFFQRIFNVNIRSYPDSVIINGECADESKILETVRNLLIFIYGINAEKVRVATKLEISREQYDLIKDQDENIKRILELCKVDVIVPKKELYDQEERFQVHIIGKITTVFEARRYFKDSFVFKMIYDNTKWFSIMNMEIGKQLEEKYDLKLKKYKPEIIVEGTEKLVINAYKALPEWLSLSFQKQSENKLMPNILPHTSPTFIYSRTNIMQRLVMDGYINIVPGMATIPGGTECYTTVFSP